jgi:Transmembrane domain of unknown function (DUF3566)
LDRRTNRPNGSGGASPTVVTDRQDDDLTADTDEPTQILGSSPVRTATRPARPAPSTKEAAANGAPATDAPAKEGLANGLSATDGTEADVPALPADTIGSARDPFAFSRPVSVPVSPSTDDDWTPAENGALPSAAEPVLGDSVPAATEPEPAEPFAAETGTGWPIDTSMFETGSSTAGDPSPPQPPDAEPSVSAAAFVWNPPEPAPTSPSSPARNFLRSNATAKTTVPPRPSPVSVGPGKAQAGPAANPQPSAGTRPKGPGSAKRSAKRSARQAHLTIARVEPWSVMKFSFVVSLVAFVILFVAVSVLYGTLSALGVFTSLQHVVQSVTSSQDSSGVNAAKWFTASRVLSYTAILGAVNIVLITAMSTIGAVIYNLTSRLIGGVEVTLRETE